MNELNRFSLQRRQLLAAVAASTATVATPQAWSQNAGRVLRVGHQKGWLSILKGRGTLEKRLAPLGVKVTWTEFNAGPVQLEALNVGSIDFGDVGEQCRGGVAVLGDECCEITQQRAAGEMRQRVALHVANLAGASRVRGLAH